MTKGWRKAGPEMKRARAELERYCAITADYTIEQCKEVFRRAKLSQAQIEIMGTWPPNEFRDVAGELLFGMDYECEDTEMAKQGLYDKYRVTKTDGTPPNAKSEYFVLNIGTDPHARVAAQAYAESVKGDNLQLAKDIMVWLIELEERDNDGPESD